MVGVDSKFGRASPDPAPQAFPGSIIHFCAHYCRSIAFLPSNQGINELQATTTPSSLSLLPIECSDIPSLPSPQEGSLSPLCIKPLRSPSASVAGAASNRCVWLWILDSFSMSCHAQVIDLLLLHMATADELSGKI